MNDTQRPAVPPAQEAMWYYAFNARRMGPVTQGQLAAMLAGGQLSSHTPVWRQGMADWLPASRVEALRAASVPTPPPLTSPVPRATPDDKKIKNARQNCIVMFVIFAALVLLTVTAVATRLANQQGPGHMVPMFGCVGWTAPLAAIFAAIYLPLRWRVIMQLSPPIRALGVIGGFGLIAMTLLGVAGLLLGLAGGFG